MPDRRSRRGFTIIELSGRHDDPAAVIMPWPCRPSDAAPPCWPSQAARSRRSRTRGSPSRPRSRPAGGRASAWPTSSRFSSQASEHRDHVQRRSHLARCRATSAPSTSIPAPTATRCPPCGPATRSRCPGSQHELPRQHATTGRRRSSPRRDDLVLSRASDSTTSREQRVHPLAARERHGRRGSSPAASSSTRPTRVFQYFAPTRWAPSR